MNDPVIYIEPKWNFIFIYLFFFEILLLKQDFIYKLNWISVENLKTI